ncbi:hypothetical protein [Limibacterium fermenti]|uniref:hypothetical protein n=1 Tax=Limibacterium fermenti TaxID=3229863 RepID=UPI003A68155F
MIQALLKNKLKDSFTDPHFTPSEDSLTSSIIGMLQYLPDTVFWQLLRSSCGKQSKIPKEIGEIKSIQFWEKMTPDGKQNSRYVEPDVWIEAEKFDVIIEAKKRDCRGQCVDQWKKEILSFSSEVNNINKTLIFIALGGNILLQDCTLSIGRKQYNVYTSSWYNLLHEISNYAEDLTLKSQPEGTKAITRLLNDIISVFSKHGYVDVKWLSDLQPIHLNNRSEEAIASLLEFDNKRILQDFYNSKKQITTNNIFKIWKLK